MLILSIMVSIGIILYACFAYLVAQSKIVEVRRRWRYSILWGVFLGAFVSILFALLSVLAFFGDQNELGYMAAFRSPISLLNLFIGIILFLAYPVLIGLSFAFLFTFVTYWQELQRGDMFVNRLLYPVKKHPSDNSSDSVFDQARTFIAKFVDGQIKKRI
jgi:hypothetical protein